MYDRLEVNGEVVYAPEEFDPWFEQDRVFIEAVRTGKPRPAAQRLCRRPLFAGSGAGGMGVGAARRRVD